jgi:hypothetical protein
MPSKECFAHQNGPDLTNANFPIMRRAHGWRCPSRGLETIVQCRTAPISSAWSELGDPFRLTAAMERPMNAFSGEVYGGNTLYAAMVVGAVALLLGALWSPVSTNAAAPAPQVQIASGAQVHVS